METANQMIFRKRRQFLFKPHIWRQRGRWLCGRSEVIAVEGNSTLIRLYDSRHTWEAPSILKAYKLWAKNETYRR